MLYSFNRYLKDVMHLPSFIKRRFISPKSQKNWQEWMDLDETSRDLIFKKARAEGLYIFPNETEKDVHERIVQAENLKINKRSATISKIVALITLLSAIATVVSVLKKYRDG